VSRWSPGALCHVDGADAADGADGADGADASIIRISIHAGHYAALRYPVIAKDFFPGVKNSPVLVHKVFAIMEEGPMMRQVVPVMRVARRPYIRGLNTRHSDRYCHPGAGSRNREHEISI
jgi:hypothetical protein